MQYIRAVFLALCLALCAFSAQASHFRSATYSWERSALTPLNVTFHVEQAWRWSAYGNPALNTAVNVGSMDYGDNSFGDLFLIVNAINSAEDWFVGTSVLTHRYASAGIYKFVYSSCCRVSTLRDGNNDLSEIQTNTVNLTANAPLSSIKVGSLPIVFFLINSANAIAIPYVSGNGPLPVTFSITPTSQSGLNTASPSGLSVTSTGTINWTPSVAGLYALSLTAKDGANTVILDFILQVAASCTTNCNHPPAFVPSSPPSVTLPEGTLVQQDITAVDPDGDAPDIFSAGLPQGATLSPCARPTANTCTRTLSWIPPVGTGNTFICFTTSDGKPNGNFIGQYCMSVFVVQAQHDTLAPSSGTGGVTSVECASLGGAINNKRCFVPYPNNANLDYSQADLLCKAKAGSLAVFRDVNDNNAAKAAIGNHTAYIGLTRQVGSAPVDASFQWIDGSSRSFSNWAATEPNNLNDPELCAALSGFSGQWSDVSCSTALYAVCQFDVLTRDVTSQECTTQNGAGTTNCAATCSNPTDCSRPIGDHCVRNNTAEPPAPVFVNNHTESFLDAKTLQLTFLSSYEFYATSFQFVNASGTGYCDHSLFDPSTNWYDEATNCGVKYVARFYPPKALGECFTKTTSQGKICYDAIILITTRQKRPAIRGTPLERLVVTAKRLRFCFPTLVTVSLSTNLTVYGPQIILRELTEQVFDPSTETTRVRLFTSVQYPYKLEPLAPGILSSAVSPVGYSITPTVAAAAGYSCPNTKNVCEQTWDTTVSQLGSICLIEPTVTFNFRVICDPSYAGNCSAINPNTYSVQFSLASNDYCVKVVEDVQLSGTLTPYSQFPVLASTPADYNFIYNQMAYFGADVQADSGPGISSSQIENVQVTSANSYSITFNRQTILGSNPNQYFYFDSTSVQPTRSYFGFQINSNTVQLTDPDQPQSVGVTALVSVTYFNLVREYREIMMSVNPHDFDLMAGESSQSLALGATFGVEIPKPVTPVTPTTPTTPTTPVTPANAAAAASDSTGMVAIIAGVVAGVAVVAVVAGLVVRYRRNAARLSKTTAQVSAATANTTTTTTSDASSLATVKEVEMEKSVSVFV